MKLVVGTNRVLDDEIQERVRFEYLRMISRYLPGRITPDGSVRTYGFKAFLETQLPYKVRDAIRRCVADFGHNEPDDHLDQLLTTSEYSIGITDSTAEILRALKKATRSRRDAELLKAFIYEDGALAEFAERYGASAAKIRRGIEAICTGGDGTGGGRESDLCSPVAALSDCPAGSHVGNQSPQRVEGPCQGVLEPVKQDR
jgi:hypothetical protein